MTFDTQITDGSVFPLNMAVATLDAIRSPFLVLDEQMSILYSNKCYCELFQTTQPSIAGRRLYDIDEAQWDQPELRTMLEEARSGESKPYAVEIHQEFPRIGLKSLTLQAGQLPCSSSQLSPILLSIEDVTERHSSERQVQMYIQKLEWSNRELLDFAYIASHDLQEPLRAIQAFSERLLKQVGSTLADDSRDSLDRILRAADRMHRLISDLLEFSRINTKGRPFSEVDLNLVVQQVQVDLHNRVDESGGLIQATNMPTVQADFTQMRQLLQNIVGNALKYAQDGVKPLVLITGELIEHPLETKVSPDSVMCRIIISDNGIGFEEEHVERIFTPFQRLHGRDKYGGTGIGLAICRKIVERHGGRIDARSELGVGSVFTVIIPVNNVVQSDILQKAQQH